MNAEGVHAAPAPPIAVRTDETTVVTPTFDTETAAVDWPALRAVEKGRGPRSRL